MKKKKNEAPKDATISERRFRQKRKERRDGLTDSMSALNYMSQDHLSCALVSLFNKQRRPRACATQTHTHISLLPSGAIDMHLSSRTVSWRYK